MRLCAFKAAKVHGHMDFDIRFFDDLTFLTGINGSGKTTIVRGISALMPLSITELARIEHEYMEIECENEGRSIRAWSRRTDEALTLGNSASSDELSINLYIPDDGLAYPTPRSSEKEADYYREVESEKSNHPVLKFARSLPSPMVLGIERRTRDAVVTDRDLNYRGRRYMRSTFGSSLEVGLQQAAELAEESYRKVQGIQNSLTDDLRRCILLSALKYEDFQKPRLIAPPGQLKGEIESKRQIVRDTLQGLGLEGAEVEHELEPFFNKLGEVSKVFQSWDDVKKALGGKDPKKSQFAVEWIINSTQFNRIGQVFADVEEYIKKREAINEPIGKYLGIVNNFLRDSGKNLAFDGTGHLFVNQGGSPPISISSLSSGERQIIVMITHLSFNPSLAKANVFIVDEPELSLHLRWQELFVKAIREANSNLQLILATHSPSIILDDIEHCIDLTRGPRC